MHSERKPKLGPRAVTVGTLQAFLWTVLSVALSVGSLAAEKAFRKVDVKLPDITADVLDAAILLRHYWYLGLLAACCWPLVNWGWSCSCRLIQRPSSCGGFGTWSLDRPACGPLYSLWLP